MTPELAGKLLKICRPFRPNIDRAAYPEFLCTTPEMLRINNIDPSEFTASPPTIYDGMDSEVRTQGDSIVDKRDVYVFMKHGLEKLTQGKVQGYER